MHKYILEAEKAYAPALFYFLPSRERGKREEGKKEQNFCSTSINHARCEKSIDLKKI